jgi:UV DNA damage endonuclease
MHSKPTFQFGYACICTELRTKEIFTSRTCRMSTLIKNGSDVVKNLALKNLHDLLTILKWNVENEIYFMRISSGLFPFASHKDHLYSLDFADDLLKEIGEYAKSKAIRLTMHPGQYNILSSPKVDVISNTIRDLRYQCDVLDRMQMGKDSVLIIHGGGAYDSKEKALQRLEQNIRLLPQNVRDRLVLENCEMVYTVEDLLVVSEKLNVPLVIDFHHDELNPSSQPVEFYFDRVFAVWTKRGIKPKVHVSNSVEGVDKTMSKTARRKHSDVVRFLHQPLLTINFEIDVMLECKLKEQSIFLLRK